jgi:hypothetical protein
MRTLLKNGKIYDGVLDTEALKTSGHALRS